MTDKDTFISYQSDALVLKLARFVWQMHILSAFVLWFVLRDAADFTELSIWVGWMVVWGLAQGWVSFQGSADERKGLPLTRWARLFDITAIMAACGYGWLAFSLLPAGNEPLAVFVGFIISGGVLTGTGTHNMHYPMLAATLLIIIPAQAANTYIDDIGGQGAVGAMMLMAFLGLMLGLGWVLRTFTRNGFVLQWEKAQLAEELSVARQEAEDANLAKSRFLAQASHDLRQPVHSMGLFLASLEREALSEAVANLTNRLTQSVDVLSKLFNSLLDVTLLDAGKLDPSHDPVSLDVLTNSIAVEFAPAAEAEACSISVVGDEVYVLSDPILLRRVVQNLVSNAIRHGEGNVLIETDVRGEGIFISVRDSGPGIDRDAAKSIFEAFERPGGISDSAEGLGLGLAIVRRLCAALATKVVLDESEGKGARFVVGPLMQTSAPHSTVETQSGDRVDSVQGIVVVVDDDTATLEATASLLSNWGWDIQTFARLKTVQSATLDQVDLIVTDFELRNGDTGLDVISQIQATQPNCPSIVISGNSSDEVREAVEASGSLLLLKPVRPAQLRSAILSLIGR